MTTQLEKPEARIKPRIEVRQDFFKELEDMDDPELNTVITNFRRYKAVRIEEQRKNNPGFAFRSAWAFVLADVFRSWVPAEVSFSWAG